MMSEAGATLFEELMRFRPHGLTANGWAVRAGVSRTIWADLRRHGNPSRRTLEKLLTAVGSCLAEFEALRADGPGRAHRAGDGFADPGRSWRGSQPGSIPLFATSLAVGSGDLECGFAVYSIDRKRQIGAVERPSGLGTDSDAYAVTIAGASMWPRFREGRRLIVSPAPPVTIGDDVLIELAVAKVLIAELAGRSSNLVQLRQFNPDVTFRVEAKEIIAVHKVLGEAI